MILQSLRTLLLNENSVADLLSNSAASGELRGVYCGRVPELAEPPYLLLSLLEDAELGTLGTGDGYGIGTLREADVDIDCKATTWDQANALARTVDRYLDDFAGAGLTGITIKAVGDEDGLTLTPSWEDPHDGRGYGLHVCTLNGPFYYEDNGG